MIFRTKEEAELWKSIIKIRIACAGTTREQDVAIADKCVLAFRERKGYKEP